MPKLFSPKGSVRSLGAIARQQPRTPAPVKPPLTIAQRVARTSTRINQNTALTPEQKTSKLAFQQSRLPAVAAAPAPKKKGKQNFDWFLRKAEKQIGGSYDTASAGLERQRPDIAARYAGLLKDIGAEETQTQGDINKQKVTDIGAIQARAAKAGVFRSSDETGQELQYSSEVADRLARLTEAANIERRKLGEGQKGEESDLTNAIAQTGLNKAEATRELALERFTDFQNRRDKKRSDKQQLEAELYKADADSRERAADRELKMQLGLLPYESMTENQRELINAKLGIAQAGIEATNARQLLGLKVTAGEKAKDRALKTKLSASSKGKTAAERMKQFQGYLKDITRLDPLNGDEVGKYGRYSVPEWKIGQVAKKYGVKPGDFGVNTSPSATIARWRTEGKSEAWIAKKAKANKWDAAWTPPKTKKKASGGGHWWENL